ncbi:carbohydrate kinase family protein [Paenibacillus cisolokensis]|uniref:carbohydrate kinase family protein n=1 Tax=Paenibacillus cisolokensis TaxID=1658519 RepID=UPI003D2D315E
MADKTEIVIFGGIIVDQYVLVDRYPERGGDALMTDSFFRIGGCAINVGSTLQNLGMTPHIVSTVGDDAWGRKIREYLKQRQFSELAIRYAEQRNSGYCISVVEKDGERTFLTYKGCEADFQSGMIGDDLCGRVSHVYVTGYYLLDPEYDREIVRQLKKLKEAGAFVVFDPGPLASSISEDTLLAVLGLADLIIPNESELDLLERKLGWNRRDFSGYWERGILYIVLKKGSQGVEVWTDGDYFTVPPYPVNSIDSTGAGDSFAGGLLYGLSKGYDLRTSVKMASACGAITTTIMGPHGRFTLQDVTDMMEKAR